MHFSVPPQHSLKSRPQAKTSTQYLNLKPQVNYLITKLTAPPTGFMIRVVVDGLDSHLEECDVFQPIDGRQYPVYRSTHENTRVFLEMIVPDLERQVQEERPGRRVRLDLQFDGEYMSDPSVCSGTARFQVVRNIPGGT